MSPYLEELVISEVALEMSYQRENELGNIMTTIMHNALPKSDFVILNPGGFRTTWVPGLIQYQHFYNMFPFDNMLKTFDVTGQ
jgi:2',3'-cyclic-nucleotide 2'-phosphodiesterase (5'-nucleotidase family)